MMIVRPRPPILTTTLILACGALVSPSQASVLTFDIARLINFQGAAQTYGDNVTSAVMGDYAYGIGPEGPTPDVIVDYLHDFLPFPLLGVRPTHWTTGYGDLTNVLFEDRDVFGVLTVLFTTAPGHRVSLHSFDLAAYTTAFTSNPMIDSVKIFDSSNATIFSQSNVTVSRTTHTSLTLNPLLIMDTSLRMEIDARNLGGKNDEIAVDNIRFSQDFQAALPEPSSVAAWCLLMGTVAVARFASRIQAH